VYARKSIIILDDVMSGLDPETEEVLFMELFGPKGLFKQEWMTVIMATNAGRFPTFLSRRRRDDR
jgi:ATP-binding cassette subfamily C (CFTR/MRP) protein 1